MGYYRQKNKFELYFWGIFGFIYYGSFLLGIIFAVGYGLFKLVKENWIWFAVLSSVIVSTLIFIYLRFKRKKRETLKSKSLVENTNTI